MNWGPERSRRTQPTGYGGKQRDFARSNPAKHAQSPIRAAADRTAPRSSAARPLEILFPGHFECRFVLDAGGMIPLIRAANEKLLEHRQSSLLSERPKGVPGERSWGPFAELFEGVETGRSEAPPCLVEPGRGRHSLAVAVNSIVHAAGSSKLLDMMPQDITERRIDRPARLRNRDALLARRLAREFSRSQASPRGSSHSADSGAACGRQTSWPRRGGG